MSAPQPLSGSEALGQGEGGRGENDKRRRKIWKRESCACAGGENSHFLCIKHTQTPTNVVKGGWYVDEGVGTNSCEHGRDCMETDPDGPDMVGLKMNVRVVASL